MKNYNNFIFAKFIKIKEVDQLFKAFKQNESYWNVLF
jgi:hypothetical protein